jgi:hypothetical protein
MATERKNIKNLLFKNPESKSLDIWYETSSSFGFFFFKFICNKRAM